MLINDIWGYFLDSDILDINDEYSDNEDQYPSMGSFD